MTGVPVHPGGRFLLIDALRGLAALAVVAFHVQAGRHVDALSSELPWPVVGLLRHGDLGVQVFFVLSGFVIAHSIARHDVTVGYVGRFMVRRSVRLDPPYWVSIALVVGLGLISARIVPGKRFPVPDAQQLLAHIVYLQDVLGVPALSSIYWTLCFEIQFYLIFSLLMLAATRLRRRLSPAQAFAAVVLPAVAIADLWALGVGPFDARGLCLGSWHMFMAGVLVWWAVVARPRDRLARAFAVANLVLLAAAGAWHVDAALGVIVAVGALIFAAGQRGSLATWLSARPLQALGAISYSLYLVHIPITGAVFYAGYRLTGRTAGLEALWLPVVIAACLLIAYLVHCLVEKPSLAVSRRIRLPGSP